jgi:hypothetical protein
VSRRSIRESDAAARSVLSDTSLLFSVVQAVACRVPSFHVPALPRELSAPVLPSLNPIPSHSSGVLAFWRFGG